MVREREAEAELCGELRAEIARAEQPDRGHTHVGGHGVHMAERMILGEIVGEKTEQLGELLRKFVGENGLARATQRECGDGVGAGRASEAEIDSTRMQALRARETLRPL